ncbi:LuxR C-terminal-related transcriptional regulator [Algiphilus sp.]|uniref:LuxR C-terminal-related transcriptional regulator n=1 Tax=Algiphilus sp. TaxID=1872431 RepID=UPI0032EF695C
MPSSSRMRGAMLKQAPGKDDDPAKRMSEAVDSPTGAAGENSPQAPTTVTRTAALERLKTSPRTPLVLIQGPAGFGKTTLLRQYSRYRASRGDRIAWMRMDARSADPAQFLRLLCDAADGFDERQRKHRAESEARPRTLQDFYRALDRLRGGGLIVIDNFEQAFTADLEGVFLQVVRNLPPGVQLCIGSRVLPSDHLASLRMRGEMIVVDEHDLRFDREECGEFLREFPGLSAADITVLHQRTDGWPAALQCIRLCLQRGREHRGLAYAGKGITQDLISFLAAEVFSHLSEELQSTLFLLCVPEKLNSELVSFITGDGNSQALIDKIERAGLFLSQVDLEGHWYRFHNLFRRFLLARMRQQTEPDALRLQQQRIGDWYAAHGYREEAVQHWIEAGNLTLAAAIMDEVCEQLVAEERLGLIEQYVDHLPVELVLEYERLANAAIIAYGFRRAFDKAHRLITARAEKLAGSDDPHAMGVLNCMRLFVLVAQDRIEELGPAAQEAGQQLSSEDGFHYGVTLNARAMWLVGRGDFEAARGLLLRARPLHDRDGSLFGQAYQEAVFSISLSAEGRIHEAAQGLAAALRRTEEESCGSLSAGSVLAVYLADAQYEQNRIEDARTLLTDYGALAEQQAIVDPLATLFLTRARIAFFRSDTAETEAILDRALYIGYRHDFARLVACATAERVRQATLMGDLELAARLLRDLDVDHFDGSAGLLFHAGENELHTICWARYLIHIGHTTEARRVLQAEIRRAHGQRRRRRELKLTLLLAMANHAEGRGNCARRNLLEALELCPPGNFVRSFLDEGSMVRQVLKEVRRSLEQVPVLGQQDGLTGYLDHLLSEAGERAGPTLEPPVEESGGISAQLAAGLTEKERNLLRYVALGLSNKDLAERLSVSTNTVKWHLRNIFEKLQISNRVQAVVVARNLGMID